MKRARYFGAVDWSDRKELTPQQKARLTRLYNDKENSPWMRRPADYVAKRVSKTTAKGFAALDPENKGLTARVDKGKKLQRIIVPKNARDAKIKVKNGRIYQTSVELGIKYRSVRLTRRPGEDFLSMLNRTRIREGETLTVQFGNHKRWRTAFIDKERLLYYINTTLRDNFMRKTKRGNTGNRMMQFEQYVSGLDVVRLLSFDDEFADGYQGGEFDDEDNEE